MPANSSTRALRVLASHRAAPNRVIKVSNAAMVRKELLLKVNTFVLLWSLSSDSEDTFKKGFHNCEWYQWPAEILWPLKFMALAVFSMVFIKKKKSTLIHFHLSKWRAISALSACLGPRTLPSTGGVKRILAVIPPNNRHSASPAWVELGGRGGVRGTFETCLLALSLREGQRWEGRDITID